jgi:hypothetical protein
LVAVLSIPRLKRGLPGAAHRRLTNRLLTGRGERADGLLQHGLCRQAAPGEHYVSSMGALRSATA